MADALLLPSAALVPDELRSDLGRIPTGLIPLRGKPVIHHIVEMYDDVTPYVACHHEAELVEQYASREGHDWTLIDIPDSDSLGDTIFHSIRRILDEQSFEDGDQLYVNFADTIIEPNRPPGDVNFVSYDVKDNPIRWTCFEGRERITSIIPKFSPSASGKHRVFTGLFRFTDPRAYLDALAEALDDDTQGPDPFYVALLSFLQNHEYNLVRADEWIDVGHIDTYYQAKKQVLNVREFNSLDADDQRNSITKSTKETEILRSEYEWYTALPEEVRPYTPQVYDYSEAESELELEYIGYPSLRDLYLHGSHGLHIWNYVFETLFSMLDIFATYDESKEIRPSLESMYVEKTKRRLGHVDPDGHLAPFHDDEVTINGETYRGLPFILDGLESLLSEAGVLDVEEFSVIHGDLCFSNILFSVRNGIVKLIDPRGEFGPYVVYGDQRYDLAKLRHSVSGNYDFIINDMFEVWTERPTNDIEYEVYRNSTHDERETLFDNLLEQQYPEWSDDVRLIESLLYLSMVPLHDDSPQRQQYMLARGIELFNEMVVR